MNTKQVIFSAGVFDKVKEHHSNPENIIAAKDKLIEHQKHVIAGYKAFFKKNKIKWNPSK